MGTAPLSAPVELHLRIRVLRGKLAEFFEFLREAIPFFERPGGITIRLLEDAVEDDCFIEVVQYEDETVYRLDQERVAHDPEMKRFLSRWRSLLVDPPKVETYRLRAV